MYIPISIRVAFWAPHTSTEIGVGKSKVSSPSRRTVVTVTHEVLKVGTSNMALMWLQSDI